MDTDPAKDQMEKYAEQTKMPVNHYEVRARFASAAQRYKKGNIGFMARV